MKFRVKQIEINDKPYFIVQYKTFLFWKTVRQAWVSDDHYHYPDYINNYFNSFDDAVRFAKNLDELKLKVYQNKQKETVIAFIRKFEDHQIELKKAYPKEKLYFEFTSKK